MEERRPLRSASSTTTKDVQHINIKIETPDKENAQFSAGLRLRMRDTDPDYPAHGHGKLHVRRRNHGAPARSRPQSRRLQLQRFFKLQRSRRRRCRGIFRFGYRQSRQHSESRSQLPRRTHQDAERSASRPPNWPPRRRRIATIRIGGRSSDGGLLNLIAAREQYGRTLGMGRANSMQSSRP